MIGCLRRLLDRVPTWALFLLNVLLWVLLYLIMVRSGVAPPEVV